MTFTHALSTNNYGCAKFIVDGSSAANGTHTTIAAALTSASSGDTIFIRPGTYTENLTLKAGVNLTAYVSDSGASGQGPNVTPNVIIKGTASASFTGNASYSGIQFLTNAAAAIATSGANSGQLIFNNCSVNANDATGITFNAVSYAVTFANCVFNSASTNILFAETTSGGCVFQNCIIRLSATSGASTLAVANFSFTGCNIQGFKMTTATSGGITVNNCTWIYAANILLTMAGTGTSTISNSEFESTSASTFSIGVGCTLNLWNSVVNSTNTNAITGAGTLNYGGVTFSGSSSTVNTTTTTRSPLTVLQGGTGLTSTTSQQILYSSATNTISGLTSGNSLLAATNSSGTLAMRAFSVVTQVFTSTGTYTPTAGMLYCKIECLGGGGAGGGAAATGAATTSCGAGGGAGEYASGVFSAATIGASKSVTIGAAGTANSGATGGNGGNTSVGSTIISANGGTGGIASGVAGDANADSTLGGTGGTGGDFRSPGSPGGWANSHLTPPIVTAGLGGSTLYGAGGRVIASGVSNQGGAGLGYGAGGGGSSLYASQTALSGGAGVKGVVIVTEYVIA